MYGYIYETTNLINGKKYIGKHKFNKFDKNYYGSGTNLKKALNKYGKENFKVIILEEVNTNQEDLDKAEIRWIEAANAVRSDKYYNNSYGGENEGWYPYHKVIKDNPGLNPWLNRNHTEETKKKISESRKGKIPWNKGLTKETDKRIKDYTNKMINSKLGSVPWNKGLTKETDSRLHGYTHSNETKRKVSETLRGHIVLDETKTKISKSRSNRKWINNGIENKCVKLEELNLYIKHGYKLGRI